jgi:hypothetical protein
LLLEGYDFLYVCTVLQPQYHKVRWMMILPKVVDELYLFLIKVFHRANFLHTWCHGKLEKGGKRGGRRRKSRSTYQQQHKTRAVSVKQGNQMHHFFKKTIHK